MIVFVDTSALIALIDEDDHRHRDAATAFTWLARNADLVTHNYVLVEATAVAQRKFGATAVERLTDVILPVIRVIWVDQATHESALAAHRAGGSASLVDHVSFVVMRANGLRLAFAFDPDFYAAGFSDPVVPAVAREQRQVHETSAVYGTPAVSDPVSVAEISARARASVNTVQSWRRRHADFPRPAAQLAAGPIWSWPAIAAWIARRDRNLATADA
jgi:predicted nucleic acid-binding protein